MASNKIISSIPFYQDWKTKESTEFPKFQREALKIAGHLCYPKWVSDKIKAARTVEQVNRALNAGRAEWITKEDKFGAKSGDF